MRPQKYQKFPLFVKLSPRRRDSLDRFRNFLGFFLYHNYRTLLIQISCDSRHRLKLYVVSKNECTFFDAHDELYRRAKFGEDGTTRAGCRCGNVVFVFFLSRSEYAAPCVRGVHSSNKHCVAVCCPILTRFSALFSQEIALSDAVHSSHIPRYVAPQLWRNCGQKLRKVQISAEKFVRTTSTSYR